MKFSETFIFLSIKSAFHDSYIILFLKSKENGPQYDKNAAPNKQSPGSFPFELARFTLSSLHLTCSDLSPSNKEFAVLKRALNSLRRSFAILYFSSFSSFSFCKRSLSAVRIANCSLISLRLFSASSFSFIFLSKSLCNSTLFFDFVANSKKFIT